ncbi:MAG: DUF853 family protein [Proteobacteria bacterium]|nr:DUF853 family protein [Pseudomonadota bacterium]
MAEPILIAQRGTVQCQLLPSMANRHGLITGATGSGKTVSLQVLAEAFSRIGTPVFMADVKGDLAGINQAGLLTPKLEARLKSLGLPEPQWRACPVTLWDVFGEQGHPVRATISDMGPLLLARLLQLNETQAGVLNLVFKIADDSGLLLLDLKDLRAMLKNVGDEAPRFTTEYGNISAASIGAIQRGLLQLQSQNAEQFFGEPMLNIDDLMQTDGSGRGMINILAAERLYQSPRLYATFLLWLLSELFERLPEVGDVNQPKLVLFFDEAHLLFTDAPLALVEKVEQVVRLIRSKGVGIFFITQNPLDIPDRVLGQLGNRVQHALRAYTPRDQKAVRAAAETMRPKPGLNLAQAITELAVGEALVSLLDEKGRPSPTERVWMLAPGSRMGPISPEERRALMQASLLAGVYDKPVDRESAYELLKGRVSAPEGQGLARAPKASETADGWLGGLGSLGRGTGRKDSMLEALAKSAARSIGSTVGRELIRGVLGSLLGGRR